MIFNDISKEYKKIFVLLIATNLVTATTTSSKRVVDFLRTPFTNKENISSMQQNLKSLTNKVDTLIVTTEALNKNLKGLSGCKDGGVSLKENIADARIQDLDIASN